MFCRDYLIIKLRHIDDTTPHSNSETKESEKIIELIQQTKRYLTFHFKADHMFFTDIKQMKTFSLKSFYYLPIDFSDQSYLMTALPAKFDHISQM